MPGSTSLSSASTFAVPFDSGFQPDFFRPPPIQAASPDPQPAAGSARIVYCADRYGAHAQFCRHEDFARFRSEVTGHLRFLGDFCRRHRMPDASIIDARLQLFEKHRFEQAYFDKQVEVLDSAGKASLDSFCDMMRDERIDLDRRKAALRNLSEGIAACASGATASLIAAGRTLALSTNTLCAALWKMKEDTARGVLQQAVSREFGRKAAYVGNEIHYVNAAWNYIADAFGLPSVPDGDARRLDLAFLNACRDSVRRAVTADALACGIAEQCLGAFASQMAALRLPPRGDMTAAINAAFEVVLEDLRQGHGLDDADLLLHAFVQLDESGATYRVRRDASLVAAQLLKAMDARGLLARAPVLEDRWQDADGAWRALYTFGEGLAWMARLPGPAAPPDAWGGAMDMDSITVPDLLAWRAASREAADRRPYPPGAALRQAIRCSDDADLMNIPGEWLHIEAPLQELLARKRHAEAQRYLRTHFLYFLGALPQTARAGLVDDLFGTGGVILQLARDWYPDPWTLLGESRDEQRRSRLQRWMLQGNVPAIEAVLSADHRGRYLDAGRGADADAVYGVLRGQERSPALYEAMANGKADVIEVWHRLLRDPAVRGKVGKRLPALLTAAPSRGGAALYMAMNNGHVRAIEAYHAILADPAIVPAIKRALPSLVMPQSQSDAPGLLFAMERGHADAIGAYHAMLADPAILPHIAARLPEVVFARSRSGTTALVQALLWGRSHAIDAYHALLADPAILPYIRQALGRIAQGTRPDGASGLFKAMEKGHAGAIRAFHSLLADPALSPYLAPALRKIVRARGPGGGSGLQVALERGHADAIRAYHGLLVDPMVLPRVAKVLPDLLAALSPSGTPGLALALQNGRAPAIKAFHALVAHPQVLPHLGGRLLPLVAARRADGMPGLALALCNVQTMALAAYRDLLADAAILPGIGQDLADLLAARDASGTRGLVAAHRQGLQHSVTAFLGMLETPEFAGYIADRLDELRFVEDPPAEADAGNPSTSGSTLSASRSRGRSALRAFIERLRMRFSQPRAPARR